jgi:hypothetical protein
VIGRQGPSCTSIREAVLLFEFKVSSLPRQQSTRDEVGQNLWRALHTAVYLSDTLNIRAQPYTTSLLAMDGGERDVSLPGPGLG